MAKCGCGLSKNAELMRVGADRLLHAVLACAPMGFLVLDDAAREVAGWRVMLINQRLQLALGLGEAAAEGHAGRPVEQVLPASLAAPVIRLAEQVNRTRQGVYQQEVIVEVGSGCTRHWMAGACAVQGEGQSAGVAVSLLEITDHVMMDQMMAEQRDAAEAASQAKDRILAMLSHELRSPLMPILSAVSAMQDDADVPPRQREALAMVRRNVELEARLIDDLLDVTRLSSGKVQLHPQRLDVTRILAETLQMCGEQIREKSLQVRCDAQPEYPVVEADPARIQQVLWNLVQNAVKFTPRGGWLSLRAFNPAADRMSIEVADSGIGIDPEVIERIFQPFEQGDATTGPRFGGLGLGLTISRGFVEAHGGRLWAYSEGPGRGSTFTVELPACQEGLVPGEPPAAPVSVGGDGCPRRILVVDDHADTRRAMKLMLERGGHTVVMADSVAGAELAAAEGDFDLLISDIGLPDGSGLELVGILKRRWPGLRAIALSGYGMEDDRRQCLEAGFERHVLKPVDPATFLGIVADCDRCTIAVGQ